MREKAVISDATNLASDIAEGRVDAICKYLEVRFGAESQSRHNTIRTIADWDTLSRIINRIFAVSHLNDAKASRDMMMPF